MTKWVLYRTICIDRCRTKEYYGVVTIVPFLSCWYKKNKTVRLVVSISKCGAVFPDGFPTPKWDPETHLKVAEQLDITTTMLSITSPHINFGDVRDDLPVRESLTTCRSAIYSPPEERTALALRNLGSLPPEIGLRKEITQLEEQLQIASEQDKPDIMKAITEKKMFYSMIFLWNAGNGKAWLKGRDMHECASENNWNNWRNEFRIISNVLS